MMIIPTPPSEQMTIVLVDELPSKVPVVVSETFLGAEDNEDVLELLELRMLGKEVS